MEFKALRIPALTKDVAENLGATLSQMSGVQKFKVTLETQELYIMFDENEVAFQKIAEEMARVGCSLRNIDAALLL